MSYSSSSGGTCPIGFCFLGSTHAQLYEYWQAEYSGPQQRSGRGPKACWRRYCQAHPPTDMRGRRSWRKLCCRCRTAAVVVAPASRKLRLLDTCQVVDFPSSTVVMPNFEQNRVRVQRPQRLDRQAERTAILTLASCVLVLLLRLFCCSAVLLPEKLCCRCRTAVQQQ